MRFGKIFILAAVILFAFTVHAEQKADIQGVFERLDTREFTYNGEEVEIVEFLSFYCGHCYHFEKAIPVIKGNFPKKIKWKTVPIFWGEGSPKPGEAYFLAVEAGKGEAMKKALFHAIFEEHRDIGKIEVLEDVGMKAGLGFEFSRRLRNGEKAREAGEALLMANNNRIEETPSLIIAGNLKTTPGMVGGDISALKDNVITILRSIMEKK